ncbi:MAG TPA: hypothetical protein PLK55_00065 [archaeon]|jgi:hypothetical protein|nr:hypothetical protein [archaeon]
MPLKPIKPTGIHLVRAREKALSTHSSKRSLELKKKISNKDLKEMQARIKELKQELRSQEYRVSKFKTVRELNSVKQKLLKEKIRIQGKLLAAFDDYYSLNGELKRIYVDSLEVYGKDLLERQKMNSEILKMLNKITKPEEKDMILRIIRKNIKLYYHMDIK